MSFPSIADTQFAKEAHRAYEERIETLMAMATFDGYRQVVDRFVEFGDWVSWVIKGLAIPHKERPVTTPWEDIIRRGGPELMSLPVPERDDAHERAAREEAQSRTPGLFGKLRSRGASREAAEELELARAIDDENHRVALEAHRRKTATLVAEYERGVKEHRSVVEFAEVMVAGDVDAYEHALEHLPWLTPVFTGRGGLTAEVEPIDSDTVEVNVEIGSIDEHVPEEHLRRGKRGGVISKPLVKKERNGIYQDFVCGAALRVARDIFALLPIESAQLAVFQRAIDSATGHAVTRMLLCVEFDRVTLEKLRLENVDASDCMSNFAHEMKWSPLKGFSEVS